MRGACIALAVFSAAGVPVSSRAQDDAAAQRVARELVPGVERAVGLRFRRPPSVEVRTREQVRSYVNRKIAEQLPPAELTAASRAYQAFGLLPEAADLRRLMLDLYSEQVAGYYDPDSSVLYVVRGADPMVVRLILAHELVHALQDQYMPLNAILKLRRQNDRQMAGQAVAEGQATLASLTSLVPEADLGGLQVGWSQMRDLIRLQQASMPVFASAPRIIQESLIFPYLAGADFMRSFNERRTRPDEQPYGDRMPVSTEQILHASRYTARDAPRRVAFTAPARGDTLVYDDDFGEFETRIVLEEWGALEADAIAAAGGWNGDRYELRGAPSGPVLLWATAWDTAQDADEFERAVKRTWAQPRGRPDARRRQVDRLTVAGVNVVRLAEASPNWPGWRSLPEVRVAGSR